MSANGRVRRALARRVAALGEAPVEPVEMSGAPPPAGLLDELRRHLLAGETHYTTRPGMVELRERLADRIHAAGGPEYDAQREIVVTAGEGEAMLATLLALGAPGGTQVAVDGGVERHAMLFRALAVEVIDTTGSQSIVKEISNIRNVASGGFVADDWASVAPGTIVVGNLDDFAGMDSFRVGYVVGPAEIVGKIMTWKQAFSICTAAPSQRAAIWTLDKAREGGQ